MRVFGVYEVRFIAQSEQRRVVRGKREAQSGKREAHRA